MVRPDITCTVRSTRIAIPLDWPKSLGTGGIGKTRLALEIAHGLDGYPDGVWLVELGALLDPELIAATIAQALPTLQHPEALSGESLAGGSRR